MTEEPRSVECPLCHGQGRVPFTDTLAWEASQSIWAARRRRAEEREREHRDQEE